MTPDDLGKREPSADARVFARNLRDMHLALLAEGFSERDALDIIGRAIIAASPGGKS